jgi:hypothetical protein
VFVAVLGAGDALALGALQRRVQRLAADRLVAQSVQHGQPGKADRASQARGMFVVQPGSWLNHCLVRLSDQVVEFENVVGDLPSQA